MSGSKYKTKQDLQACITPASSIEEDDFDIQDQEELNPSKKFGDIKHLGPVSKREMFLSKLERFSPYIHCFTIVIILFLVASAVSNLSKIHEMVAEINALETSLNNLQRTPGPKGSKGAPGVLGVAGMPGAKGVKGETGSDGHVGLKGEAGVNGAKGDKGDRGQRGESVTLTTDGANVTCLNGEKGEPGAQGEMGPKGEKGESSINPYNVWEWTHPAGQKGDRFDFRMDCQGNCRNIEIIINHSTGDVDLYGEDTETPNIRDNNCSGCSKCKSRSSSRRDQCAVAKSSASTFYFTIYVHKNYSELEVVAEALNLNKVVCIEDDCGGKIIQGGPTDGE